MKEFYTYTLPNGLRGIHRQVKSSVAHCALMINGGTRDELQGEFGLAHFTEHALFKGTEHRRAYHINCRLENLGGELNAFTTKEDTTIHATTLKGDFRKAVELIADVALHSTYPEHEIQREKEVIYDEINSYKESPSESIFDSFEDMLLAGSELGHGILGTKRDIKRYNGDSIRRFTKRLYTSDQMVFSSIGNLSVKSVEAIVAQYFGAMESTKRDFERVKPLVVAPFSVCVGKRTHQNHTIIGSRGYTMHESRRLPLALLVNILGGPSANSRLNMVVRERHALTYSIEANYTPYSDCGIFSIYFSSEKANTDHAIELVHKEMDSLCKSPLTARQLSMAKRQFIAQMAISMESNEGYMLGVGKSFMVHNSVDTAEEVYRKILDISSEELLEVARETMSSTSMLMYK
ncbi:MAG: pitrilysin family protein [Rikenellaceae bacterium]